MADTVNVGVAANSGTGDTLRKGGQAINAALEALSAGVSPNLPYPDLEGRSGFGGRSDGSAGLDTVWIEFDALLQPGVITFVDQGGSTIQARAAFLVELLVAHYNMGVRRFIISYISYQGRTYTTWTTTPKSVTGTTYKWWRDDVGDAFKPNVDNFDPVAKIFSTIGHLPGVQIILPLDRHDDVNLLNDLATVFAGGSDPLYLGKTVTTRVTEEIARTEADLEQLQERFKIYNIGYYLAHECAHLQSGATLIGPIADLVHAVGAEFHISCADPIDRGLGVGNTLADALLAMKADVLWIQPSVGYGYNHSTGKNTYAHNLTVYGVAEYIRTFWRALVELARGRPTGGFTPNLGVNIENWRHGRPGVGALTFAATSGTNIVCTLGTAASVVSADIGLVINVRVGMLNGRAEVKAIDSTTQIRVDILETLSSTGATSGFWAFEPRANGIYPAYPADPVEMLVELQACAQHVEMLSIYSAGYMCNPAMQLAPLQNNANRADWATRANALWAGVATGVHGAVAAANFLAWGSRGLRDEDGDRLLVFRNASGGGADGRIEWQPWAGVTSYTPTVAPTSGTITAMGATSGWYSQTGKVIQGGVDATITTNGTGSGSLNVTLPFAASKAATVHGVEVAVSGKGLAGYALTGTSLLVTFADGTYPGANGARIVLNFTYAIA